MQNVVSLSVLLLDRYLSAVRQFPRTNLQLAAAAAVLIASKFDSTQPPSRASRIASLSDGVFDEHRLVHFEHTMCQSVGSDLYGPSTQNFLDMFMHVLPQPRSNVEAYYVQKVRTSLPHLLPFYLACACLVPCNKDAPISRRDGSSLTSVLLPARPPCKPQRGWVRVLQSATMRRCICLRATFWS